MHPCGSGRACDDSDLISSEVGTREVVIMIYTNKHASILSIPQKASPTASPDLHTSTSNVSPRQASWSTCQTRQAFTGSIGWPTLHPKGCPNSGIFCTTPLARASSEEWGLVCTCRRNCSGRVLPHQQDPSRKVDVVHQRVIVGVHSRWRHDPLSAIDRLSDFVKLPVVFKYRCPYQIS